MLTVLADDITGAAEIAGIAHKNGLNTALLIYNGSAVLPFDNDTDVAVLATDIRSMQPHDAAQLISSLPACSHLYVKTDSVLRGHIALVLSGIMQRQNYTNALLIAQNPSKGRTISNGLYFINGKPLAETSFSYDPEFPARSSVAADVVRENSKTMEEQCVPSPIGIVSLPLESNIKEGEICIADASSREDIILQFAKATGTTLLAGGADFFGCVIEAMFSEKVGVKDGKTLNDKPDTTESLFNINNSLHANGKTLVVCGSTQSKSILSTPYFKLRNTIEQSIPDDVFEGVEPDSFIQSAIAPFASSDAFILRIGNHEVKGKEYAQRLKSVMAETVATLLTNNPVSTLIIEGGATAFSVLSRLNWSSFAVTQEYAPGVVGIDYNTNGHTTHVILKPGSYPWGALFGITDASNN